MIRLSTDRGLIAVDNDVYTNIAGHAATNCFGVKGMAVRSVTDGLVHLLRIEAMSKGVKVIFEDDGSITINLHIMVDRGSTWPPSALPSSAKSSTMSQNPPAQPSRLLTSMWIPSPKINQCEITHGGK